MNPMAAALPALIPRALATLTCRSPCPVDTYRVIATGIASIDLRTDDAEHVRRRFNAYYGVRRNAVWRAAIYGVFEAAKQRTETGAELFADLVRSLEAETGRVEASFNSKLVATLHPEYPTVDSVVCTWLGPLTEAPPFNWGVEGAIAYYRWLATVLAEPRQCRRPRLGRLSSTRLFLRALAKSRSRR